ncbi:MAG: NAD-dependent epimerase/dehydratase family protein [Acidobacteria bacterium]|nr:NAD-dependent epimerase/dehydratase family protein [Acidobacteriota bacterium]
MKILVTGGSGYLGAHICRRLKASRLKVDSLSRREGIDIRKPGSLGFLSQYDAVVHLAAHLDKSPGAADRCFAVNARGTLNILRKLHRDQIFIFASTKDVYGNHTLHRRRVDENCPTDFAGQGAYEWSKLIAEKYVQYYTQRLNLRTAILRLSTTFAPLTEGNKGSFVNFFAGSIRHGTPILLKAHGRQVRDLLHVNDLADAIECCLHAEISGEIFNIGGGPANATTLAGLVDLLSSLIGKKAALQKSAEKEPGQMRYVSDIRKIERALKWTPRMNLMRGLKTIL